MYPHKGIGFNNKKEQTTDRASTWMNLKNAILSNKKKIQAQETIYYIIPFIRNIQKGQSQTESGFMIAWSRSEEEPDYQ